LRRYTKSGTKDKHKKGFKAPAALTEYEKARSDTASPLLPDTAAASPLPRD
jgi:hypothetical protein